MANCQQSGPSLPRWLPKKLLQARYWVEHMKIDCYRAFFIRRHMNANSLKRILITCYSQPMQSLSNPYTGILSIFSTRILNGNDLDIYEDGLESRDFVYIDDVVDATILGIEKNEANGKVFNVGSGVATSVKEVAESLKGSYDSDIKISISGKNTSQRKMKF